MMNPNPTPTNDIFPLLDEYDDIDPVELFRDLPYLNVRERHYEEA